MDKENLENAVIEGSTRSFKTLADGTLVITIDVQPLQAMRAIQLIGSTEPGIPVAVTRLNLEGDYSE